MVIRSWLLSRLIFAFFAVLERLNLLIVTRKVMHLSNMARIHLESMTCQTFLLNPWPRKGQLITRHELEDD